MPGLDEFYRFMDKSKEETARDGDGNTATATANGGAPNGVRYILRHGITVAVPIEAGDSAAGLNGKLEMADVDGVQKDTGESSDALWNRLPHHIQLLASIPEPIEEEVAAKYYTRGFKETRQQLIERLLNPTLTLEETARVLGVCPATVRRYTNRGILPHHRTVGQQRRFRLSDVLIFLEQQYTRRVPMDFAEFGARPDGDEAETDNAAPIAVA